MEGLSDVEVLAALAHEYWEARLADAPTFATAIGDRRFDDRLADISPEGRTRWGRFLEDIIARVRAVEEAGLRDEDRVTRSALLTEAESELAYLRCGLDDWSVDPLAGPQVSFLNVESYQPVRTPADARAMVARWRAMGPFVDQHVGNLRGSLAAEKVAVRECVEKVIGELQDLDAKSPEAMALARPLAVVHDDWTAGERTEFREALTAAIRDSIRPAFSRYLTMLRSETLPQSRRPEMAGIFHVPDGPTAYRKLIRVYTSLDLSPDTIHETGLREVARINGEMESLGKAVFGLADRAKVLEKLRSDPELYFSTRDDVAAKAESALARAKAAIPKWFGRLPKAECVVVRMGEHEEKHSTIAYYRQPAADGSRSGSYYVNTYAPETRPRYEAEALAYHEAIPGHHLQLAIMQELTHLPAFRRHSGVTAFIEGWGLYSERLADEMGLYSSDLDRIGMLSYDAWRACRLVVDTGMHARGWSRQAAIDFMAENTALAKNNIVNEVDRYITWPGQALAYKTGQMELLRLRDEARRRLGPRFDIRAFHDVVLGDGAVDLRTLAAIVERYSAAAACTSRPAPRPTPS
jgi:uncharacterized protein (DUF885 family)